MNAIDLLKDDHREVERLFSEFLAAEDAEPDQREEIFQQIEKELLVHGEIEEQIFYPAVEDFASREVEEALQEHQGVRQAIAELLTIEVDNEAFEPKLIALMEQVQHHVQEEEAHDGLLETARRRLSSEQLQTMARAMRELKEKSADDLAA
jgi:hemerythrin superfamily protein